MSSKEYQKTWNDTHKEKVAQYQKTYRAKHPEKTKELDRKHNLNRKYKLTNGQYDEIMETQDNVCAICGKVPTTWFVIDHDHITGRVRGLLCHLCNAALGMVGDDVSILNKMILYLGGSNAHV